MSLLPFLAIAFGAGALSLVVHRPSLSAAIGLAGLAGAFAAAAGIHVNEAFAIAGGTIVPTTYLRLFLLLGSALGLILCLVGLVTAWQPNLPGAMLTGLGTTGLALALPEPLGGVVALIAGGFVGVLVTLDTPLSGRAVGVAARELRALGVVGALALVAMAWIARPDLGPLAAQPAVFGLAYLAVVVAIAMRFGAIPFHVWAARLADSAPGIALPLLMAWGPAALAVVALAWLDGSIAPVVPVAGQLPVERAAVVAIGVMSLVLGAIAAWLQDDIGHTVGYAIVADAGIILLAFAALDLEIWAPTRTWILVFVVGRTAFAAWALALRVRFGTRRIDELTGWARRSPLLAVALLLIVAGAIGWPGLVVFEARAAIVRLTTDGPLQGFVLVGSLAPLIYYGRLALVGIGRPSRAVAGGPDDRPRRPVDRKAPERPTRTRSGRVGEAWALASPWIVWLTNGLRLNRPVIAAALVVALSGAAFITSAGGFGGPAAAAAPAPQPAGQGEEPGPGGVGPGDSGASPPASQVPTEESSGSPEPGASASPGGSFAPVPTP